MLFDKERAYNIFRNNFYVEEKKQKDEINSIDIDFANRHMTTSGVYVSAHIDAYEKHILVKTDILIKAFLESFANNFIIKKKTRTQLYDEFSNYFKRETESKVSSLKSLIARSRLDKAGNSSVIYNNFYSKYSEIKTIKEGFLKSLIDLHNQTAVIERKKNSFWNTKTRIVADISAFILLVYTILNGFGVVPSLNKKNNSIPSIIKYDIQPTEIKLGESVKIVWEVENADSVLLNNAFGKVSLSDSKIIYPKKTTDYILSAYFGNKVLSTYRNVLVKDSLKSAL